MKAIAKTVCSLVATTALTMCSIGMNVSAAVTALPVVSRSYYVDGYYCEGTLNRTLNLSPNYALGTTYCANSDASCEISVTYGNVSGAATDDGYTCVYVYNSNASYASATSTVTIGSYSGSADMSQ